MVKDDRMRCWSINGKVQIKEPTGPIYEILRYLNPTPYTLNPTPYTLNPKPTLSLYSHYIHSQLSLYIQRVQGVYTSHQVPSHNTMHVYVYINIVKNMLNKSQFDEQVIHIILISCTRLPCLGAQGFRVQGFRNPYHAHACMYLPHSSATRTMHSETIIEI